MKEEKGTVEQAKKTTEKAREKLRIAKAERAGVAASKVARKTEKRYSPRGRGLRRNWRRKSRDLRRRTKTKSERRKDPKRYSVTLVLTHKKGRERTEDVA